MCGSEAVDVACDEFPYAIKGFVMLIDSRVLRPSEPRAGTSRFDDAVNHPR